MKKLDSMTIMKINDYAKSNRIYNMSDYHCIVKLAPLGKDYDDDDYLDYFVSKAFDIISKDGKINLNGFIKNISLSAVFENSINAKHKVINEETKQKILQFVPLYKLKVEQGFIQNNDNLVEQMEGLCEKFIGEEVKDFSGKTEAMYIQEISALSAKNKELSDDLNKEKSKVTKVESSSQELKDKLEKKDKTIKEINDYITSLKSNISDLRVDNQTLTNELYDEKNKNEVLSSMIEDLNLELENSKKINDESIVIEKNEDLQKNNINKFIDEIVLNTILSKKMTVDMLVDTLKACGHCVNKEDIKSSLDRLQKDRNIKISDDKIISIPKYYRVSSPFLPTNKTLCLDVLPNSCLEMLLTSDYHVRMDDDQFKRIIDLAYDYCAKNGIGTIINLGDLMYSFDKDSTLTSDMFDENERLMDYIVDNIPRDDNIAHIVLGGNHDREHSRFGVDPVTYVTQNRDDMINLGYDNATIKFSNSIFDDDFMMIHHSGLPREENFKDIKSYTDDVVAAGIKLNKAAGNDPDKNLLNVYGHQHVGRLDVSNKYVVTPALTQNRGGNGAWHLKVYFDENKKVKYMIFIPIYFEKYVKKGYETIMEPNR